MYDVDYQIFFSQNGEKDMTNVGVVKRKIQV